MTAPTNPADLPPQGRAAFTTIEGLSWAWKKFAENAKPLIAASTIWGLIVFAVAAAYVAVLNSVSPEFFSETAVPGSFWAPQPDLLQVKIPPVNPGATIAVLWVGWLVFYLLTGAIASAYYAGLLDIADARPVTVGSMFRPRNIVSVLLASLLIGVVSSLFAIATFPVTKSGGNGSLVALVVGVAVSVLTLFTAVAIVDRGLSPIGGIKTSIGMVRAHIGKSLLVWLITQVTLIVGALLCVVGLLVSVPVALLFTVYAYRKLSGGAVAPASI